MKNQDCPCTNTSCPRHGDCEACRAHHEGNPSCVRQKAAQEEKKEANDS